MRGAEWPQAGPSRTAVSPVFCCPVEVEEATENKHTSPCQFLIQPGWNRQVSEGQWLKLLLFPILRFISWKKKGEAAKWPGCAIIFWRGGKIVYWEVYLVLPVLCRRRKVNVKSHSK